MAEECGVMGSGLPIPINPTVWEMRDLTPGPTPGP